MIRKLAGLTLSILMAGAAFAADHHAKEVKLTGYLTDNACSARIAKADDPSSAIKNHTKNCALMPGCSKSGYSLLADGKWYKFDDEGNQKVAELLKNSKREKGIAVNVEGTVEGEKLSVKKISEAE
ncbi:MAG TPA: hypothetical protein VJQ56_11220 [Blastocatellia bacterium]|nr:hypothetical protein [Blastocatellia bacterium]